MGNGPCGSGCTEIDDGRSTQHVRQRETALNPTIFGNWSKELPGGGSQTPYQPINDYVNLNIKGK